MPNWPRIGVRHLKFIVLTANQLSVACMLLYVNNKPHEARFPTPTLADTLLDLQLAEQHGIAVAVNDAVVPAPSGPATSCTPRTASPSSAPRRAGRGALHAPVVGAGFPL